jgi:Conserved hypothetical protein (Lin0512_fam)
MAMTCMAVITPRQHCALCRTPCTTPRFPSTGVDAQTVAKSLPIGKIKVNVVKGGLDVIDKETGAGPVIATVAIAVRGDLEKHLSGK